jgi:hypothetical protein
MEIGGVLAPVILAMVDLNFVRSAPWEAMFCIIWPMLFLSSKISHSTSLQSFGVGYGMEMDSYESQISDGVLVQK